MIKMSELNIPLADGNKFISYRDDSYYHDGCPTCDYGSSYINELTIRTTNHIMEITVDQMYEYAINTATVICVFATNIKEMTEKEFLDYLKEKFIEIANGCDITICLDGIEIYSNKD